ncbi:MAG TPA: GtrA family protein [Streptosporangiaceae bacterium]|jgi:putative flippase GtrA
MKSLVELYHRFSQLIHELFKFGTIGVLASIVTLGVSNLLWHFLGSGPLTGSVIATVIATVIAFLGNRFWTFRHRDRTGLAREYFLFFVFNGIGLLIQLLCLGFTVYTLKLDGFWARNISNNVVGLGLGTLFRYWSYKKWVFLPPSEPPIDPHTGLPEADEANKPVAADGTVPRAGEMRSRLNGHPVAPDPEITPDR